MSEEQDQYQKLQQKLAELQRKQDLFHSEILQIKKEIDNLKKPEEVPAQKIEIKAPGPVKTETAEWKLKAEEIKPASRPEEKKKTEPVNQSDYSKSEDKYQTDLERFIGENLINKIGIAVTVIGVAIGTKYAIDHNLISPVTRIILGYLAGAVLLIFAVRLKEKYEKFSAVLLSGSMAIMYFITYAAFSFFSLFPQLLTFIIMVLITVFTVSAALRYNKEIIAIIGLVGAYAIPFLLGDNPDAAFVLFSYTAIINIGILIIAVRKYWKPLYFSAFVITWLIYFTWYFGSYKNENDFALAFSFLFLFFAIFYLTFLAYKLVKKEKFDIFDILHLLFNSFIFYGLGYSILKGNKPGDELLGLFTIVNAVIHLIVSLVIYRNKLADRNLFYLVSGLFLVFVTIAVPVQLDGNWVTLLWICQAALLFFIGRTKSAPVYEYISYTLILLSFLSICQDWGNMQMESLSRNPVNEIIPVFNIQFLSSLLFIGALGAILYLYLNKKYTSPFAGTDTLKGLLDYSLPGLFLIVVYVVLRMEISVYWNQLYMASAVEIRNIDMPVRTVLNDDLKSFKVIWLVNYSLLYFAVLTFLNIRYMKNEVFGIVLFWLSFITIFFFLFQSLFSLSELRESYINRLQSDNFDIPVFNILFRYVSFLFAGLSLLTLKMWIGKEKQPDYYSIMFRLLFHLAILWTLSSEMLNIMDLIGNSHSYRFGLSILSGVYSLMLIGLGISGRKRYLRIAAIALFAATLVKLFFYDITELDTIMKTVLFLALGALMLIISFLYNKYKNYLFGETED
jgi:uncharacterized membrane protein